MAAAKLADERLYQKFFPDGENDIAELFTDVVNAINEHPKVDIDLLEEESYNQVEEKFKDVIEIFVTYFKTLKKKQTNMPDEHDFRGFALLFKTRVKKQVSHTRVITGKSFDQTLEYISKIITNIIVNSSRETLSKITDVQPHDPFKGTGYWGGGRRSRRNSSSTRRRPRRGKSSAIKRRRPRRPHRRTSRK